MTSKHLKLAMYALTEHINPKDNMILLKKSWANHEVIKSVNSLIIPNPLSCSDFLVVNKETKALSNVTVKIIQADPNNNLSYNGVLSLTESEIKGWLDDSHLYSNIIMADGKVIEHSESFIIVIAVIGKGRAAYISRLIPLKSFITQSAGYEKTQYAKECRDSLFKKTGYIDNRPFKPGSLIDCFSTAYESTGDSSGYSIRYRKNSEGMDIMSSVVFPWQLLPTNIRTQSELLRTYPKRLKNTEEFNQAVESIPNEVLSLHVGISGDPNSKHKKLDKIAIQPYKLREMYEDYIKSNTEETIASLSYSDKKAARIQWLKTNYPGHIIFPTYTWFSHSPLRYCHEPTI